ncbi:Pol polyprotein [Plakobranchus ocellatus]|uniref:Pol polyprotein n=1 Tax=Plakobranchus ocellatus TaxID=259542 RepID=A0AAV4DGY9_9GAST|nr:Pol polyprotein [Plakobranchus ocellatus]
MSSRPFLHTVHLLSGKHFIPITAEVDTGAQISGITEATYRRHFAHIPLLPAATLRNFDNTVLTCLSLGRFLTQVKDNNRRVCAGLCVLPPRCSTVIGQKLISALGLQIDRSTMEIRAVTHDSVDIAQEYPHLLSNELGTFPDYQHEILLTDDAVRQQRIFAFSLSHDTRKSLRKSRTWMTLGFGKKAMDRSSWVHQMVTVPKPNGYYRITTDLSPLNRYVVPEHFPLSNPNDLFLELRGATFFTKLVGTRQPPSHHNMGSPGPTSIQRPPMGFKNSASVFQRFLSQTLDDCPGTIAHIDDILIF